VTTKLDCVAHEVWRAALTATKTQNGESTLDSTYATSLGKRNSLEMSTIYLPINYHVHGYELV